MFGTESVDVSIDFSTGTGFALVGVKADPTKAVNAGAAFTLYYSNEVWTEDSKLTASDAAPGDWFGKSVDVYGDIAIIGAPYKDCDSGRDCGGAYIFKRTALSNGNGEATYQWSESEKLSPTDLNEGNLFGVDVAAGENIVAVGAHRDSDNGNSSGAVYVYQYNGSSWSEEKLTPYDGEAKDTFGNKLAISGNVLAVGTAWKNFWGVESGAVYVYRDVGSYWDEEKLVAQDGAAGDHFGESIDVEGSTMVVGAPYDDDKGNQSGSVYVYRFDGESWVEDTKLTAPDGESQAEFGSRVAISDNTIVVGAKKNGSGVIYIFKKSGGDWSQYNKFSAPDDYKEAIFASPIAVSEGAIIAGAPDTSGSAYIYCDY